MTRITVVSQTRSLSDVKAKLSEMVDIVVARHERIAITRNGRPVAVLIGYDDLEATEETLAILSDTAAMRQVDEGRKAIAAGDHVGEDDVRRLLAQLRPPG